MSNTVPSANSITISGLAGLTRGNLPTETGRNLPQSCEKSLYKRDAKKPKILGIRFAFAPCHWPNKKMTRARFWRALSRQSNETGAGDV
jgi:hypothetical protein